MRTVFCSLSLLAALASAAADDTPPAKVGPKVERITYRVVGLFSPAREKALRAGFAELPGFKLIAVDFDEAEVTLEFAPAELLPNEKPERVAELVNDRLRTATGHTLGVKPRRGVPRDKLQQVVIPAAGCDCPACCLAAYEAVAALDGVYQATASFKDGRVTALIDPTRIDRAELEDALRKKGVDLGKGGKK
jgi:copper chaperone CopZ